MMAESAIEGAEEEASNNHTKLKIFLIIVALFVGLMYYLYETYGSLATVFYDYISSGGSINQTRMVGLLFQKIDSMPKLAIGYSGRITIRNDPPFNFSYMRYYNYYRTSVSLSDLPPFGNVNLVLFSKNDTQYGTLCMSGDQQIMDTISIGSVSNGYKCFQVYGNQTQLNMTSNLFINLTSLSNTSIKSYGVTIFNGQPCYFISGIGWVEVNSTVVGANLSPNSTEYVPAYVAFKIYLSAEYNIPVEVSANLTTSNGSQVYIILNQTSFNQAANESQVTSVP